MKTKSNEQDTETEKEHEHQQQHPNARAGRAALGFGTNRRWGLSLPTHSVVVGLLLLDLASKHGDVTDMDPVSDDHNTWSGLRRIRRNLKKVRT